MHIPLRTAGLLAVFVLGACTTSQIVESGTDENDSVRLVETEHVEADSAGEIDIRPAPVPLSLTSAEVLTALSTVPDAGPFTIKMTSQQSALFSDNGRVSVLTQFDDGRGGIYQVMDQTELYEGTVRDLPEFVAERDRQLAELPEDEQPFEDWSPVMLTIAANAAVPVHTRTVGEESWIEYRAFTAYSQAQTTLLAMYYAGLFEGQNIASDDAAEKLSERIKAAEAELSDLWLPVDLAANREFPQVPDFRLADLIARSADGQETALGPVELIDGNTTVTLYLENEERVQRDLDSGEQPEHILVSFDAEARVIGVTHRSGSSTAVQLDVSYEGDAEPVQAPAPGEVLTVERVATALGVDQDCIDQRTISWTSLSYILDYCNQLASPPSDSAGSP